MNSSKFGRARAVRWRGAAAVGVRQVDSAVGAAILHRLDRRRWRQHSAGGQAAEARFDGADDAFLDDVRRQAVQRALERIAGVTFLL